VKESEIHGTRLDEIREQLNGPPGSLKGDEQAALEREAVEVMEKFREAYEKEIREIDEDDLFGAISEVLNS